MATYYITLYFKGSTNDAWGYPEAITQGTDTGIAAVTLPTHVPARTGYTFSHWSLQQDGSDATEYRPGQTYNFGVNPVYTYSNVTLYAQWFPVFYAIVYFGNGGSNIPDSQTKSHGSVITLSSIVPTRAGYVFKGWGFSPSSTTVSYSPGSTYADNAAIALYAIWELEYTKPRITNIVAYRPTNNESTMKIDFDWATDKTVTKVKVERKAFSNSNWVATSFSASGTSGHVSTEYTNLTPDATYDIRITVSDASGSTTVTRQIIGAQYIIDITESGTGIAFGKAAERENTFEVGLPAVFASGLVVGGETVDGRETVFNNLYPVGTIYLSYSHTSPSQLFGGSWTRLSPYYLYATGAAGVIGETFNWFQGTSSTGSGTTVSGIKISAWRRVG